MNTGMLWFDDDPKTALAEKVSKAADYYRRKYGKVADLCLVHPSALPPRPSSVRYDNHLAEPTPPGIVVIHANRAILPGHLWIGQDDKADK